MSTTVSRTVTLPLLPSLCASVVAASRRWSFAGLVMAAGVLLAGCGGSADAPPPAAPSAESSPLVFQQPTDVTVTAPATATFSASASGVPTPAVQWQRSSDGGATFADIAGATSASYTTPPTVVGDSGQRFRAVFSNAGGSATSNAAQLTVNTGSVVGLALVAGDIGSAGTLDGSAGAARFNHPQGIAIDAAGNLFVADTGNDTIRKISTAGVVTTFAGRAGVRGGDDGPGATATFDAPTGVAVGPDGTLYVADSVGRTIRAITPSGVVSTLAGSYGMQGELDARSGSVARFMQPYGITVDPRGRIFVTDQVFSSHASGTIRSIDPSGSVSTFLQFEGTGIVPYGIVARGPYDVYFSVVDFVDGELGPTIGGSQVLEYDDSNVLGIAGGDAGNLDATGDSAEFYYANGLAIDANGNLVVADTCNSTVRAVVVPPGVHSSETKGAVTTLAGRSTVAASMPVCLSTANSTDGTASATVFDQPTGAAIDAAGNAYIVDATSSVVRRVTPAGVVTTVAGAAFQTGSTDGPAAAARFSFYRGTATGVQAATAVDTDGNVFVADTLNSDIRRISATGQVSTFAGTAGVFGDVDGTGAAASFAMPVGLAFDASGNLFVADDNGDVIRRVTPAGVVTTFAGTAGTVGNTDGTGAAARFAGPTGVAVDAAGNVFVADTGNNTIRRITPTGIVSTLAGATGTTGSADGTGGAASFNGPTGLAIDSAGNLYVADTGNQTIRKVTPSGTVSTLAGRAGASGSADGTGSAARFDAPGSVAVDGSGNVYVADTGNHTVRKITPEGVVVTFIGVAGEDGVRLGADARLDSPYGLSIGGNHLFLISAGAVLRFDLP